MNDKWIVIDSVGPELHSQIFNSSLVSSIITENGSAADVDHVLEGFSFTHISNDKKMDIQSKVSFLNFYLKDIKRFFEVFNTFNIPTAVGS